MLFDDDLMMMFTDDDDDDVIMGILDVSRMLLAHHFVLRIELHISSFYDCKKF
jgi:hypothetical protein